jgi:hypothetical protein
MDCGLCEVATVVSRVTVMNVRSQEKLCDNNGQAYCFTASHTEPVVKGQEGLDAKMTEAEVLP